MNITLRQLRAFNAAAQHASFSKAASELAITQPGFSLLIQELEAQLGARLFDRTTRRVTLTAVGEEFLPKTRRVLDDLDNACLDIVDFRKGRRGRITIAVLPSLATALMPQVLADFQERHPGIDVSIREAHAHQLQQHVADGDADLGIGVRLGPVPALRFEVLLEDHLVAVLPAGDSLAEEPKVSWAALAARPYIAIADTSSVFHLAARAFREAGVGISPAFQVGSMATAVAFVSRGLGFTLLPEMGLSMLRLDGLSVRRLAGPQAHRDIGLYRQLGRSDPPAVDAFRNVLCGLVGSRAYPASQVSVDTTAP